MSAKVDLKGLISPLPVDICGMIAIYSPKEMFLIASASNKPSLKEMAFRQAYRLRHIWISQWERDQPIAALIDRDLFYKNLTFPPHVNADHGVLLPSFYPPDLSRYSYYELHSKKPQADLTKFVNLERIKVSNIFKQLDKPKNEAEANLFIDRVHALDHQIIELHQKVKHTNITIDQLTEIPSLLKLVFVIYDFFMSLFRSHHFAPSLHIIDRPGYALERGKVRFHHYIPGSNLI